MAITFQVGFQLKGKDLQDALSSQISAINQELDSAFQNASAKSGGMTKNIQQATVAASSLQAALQKATTDKGLSLTMLKQSLASANSSVDQMLAHLAAGGPAFTQSFNIALRSIATANKNVLSLSSSIAEAGRVFAQSFKFTAAQSVIRFMSSSLRESADWVKTLDEKIASIAAVSGKTGSELTTVYETIVNGAQKLRVAAKDYADASLIFYQQGLGADEVERRTEITIQAAKAAGQSVETMASQLTAIWNTYKMVGDEQQRAAAVGAKMAASTAVDFADIATAMQNSASAASQMGVSYNSLAAIIATVGDTTQQSASTIGNAYKTIFSRFQQLKDDGTDGEVTLNSVSASLENLGVHVLDARGRLRELDDVINEVGRSWNNYSKEQQLAIAEQVGGTRQYGQFIALMNNYDKYLKLVSTAAQETGSTLVEQFIAAQNTAEAAAINSREAWSRALSNMFDGGDFKSFYNVLEKVGDLVGEIVKGFNGLPGILSFIGMVFQKQIADKIVASGIALKDIVQNSTLKGQQRAAEAESKKTRDTMGDNVKKWTSGPNSFMQKDDGDAILRKVEAANKLREVMVTVNNAISSGNEEQRIQAQAMEANLTLLTQRYTEGIDKNLELKRVMEEETAQIQAQVNAYGEMYKDRNFDQDRQDFIDTEKFRQACAELRTMREQYKAMSGDIEAQKKLWDQIINKKNEIANIDKKIKQMAVELNAKGIKNLKDLSTQEAKQAQGAALVASKAILNGGKNIADALNFKDISGNITDSFQAINFKDIINKIFNEIEGEFQGNVTGLANEFKEIFKLDPSVATQSVEDFILKINQAVATADAAGISDFIPTETLKKLIELARNANMSEESIKNLTRAVEQAKGQFQDIPKSTMKTSQAIVSTIMSVNTLYNSMSSLIGSFLDGDITLGKFMTSLVMIIPAISNLSKVLTESKLAQMLLNSEQMTSIGLSIASALGFKTAAGGVMIFKTAVDAATLGLTAIISAIVAVIGAIAGFIQYQKHQEEKMKETAEATRTAAEASRQLNDTLAQSAKTYDEARKALKELTKGTAEYADAADDAIDAAQSFADALKNADDTNLKKIGQELQKTIDMAKYTGDFGKVDEAIKSARIEEAKTNAKINNNSRKDNEAVLRNQFNKEFYFNGDVNEKSIGTGIFKNEEAALKVIDELDSKLTHIRKISDKEIKIFATQDIDDKVAAMGEMLELQHALESSLTKQQQQESSFYKNLTDAIGECSEAYKNYIVEAEGSFEAQADILRLDPEAFKAALIEMGKEVEQTIDDDLLKKVMVPEGGFTNLGDYDDWKEAIQQIGEAADWSAEQIQTFIDTNIDTSQFEAAEEHIANIVSTAVENGMGEEEATKLQNKLREMFDNLDDKSIFFTLEPNIENLENIEGYFATYEAQLARAGLGFEKSLESFKEIKSNFEGIQLGDTIEPEVYQQLIANNENLAGYFQKMEDGTYQMINKVDEFWNTLENDFRNDRMNEIQAMVDVMAQLEEAGAGNSAEYGEAFVQAQNSAQALLSSADSLAELNGITGELRETFGNLIINETLYSQALIGMASQYENCAGEIEKLQNALIGGNDEAIASAQENLRASTLIGEAAKKYGISADAAEVQAKALTKAWKEQGKEAQITATQAAQIAINNQRMNQGISKLNSNFKDWKKTLQTTEKTSQDYAQAVVDITDAVGDLIGAAENFELPEGFLDSAENMALLEQASNGSQDAINRLGVSIATSQVELMELNAQLATAANGFNNIDESGWHTSESMFNTYKETVLEGIQAIQDNLDNLQAGQSLEDVLNVEDWVTALNQMAIATGMSVDEMNGLLSEIGVTADVTTTDIEQPMSIPTYYDGIEEVGTKQLKIGVNPDTEEPIYNEQPLYRRYSIPGEPMEVIGHTQVAQISTDGTDPGKPNIKSLTYTGTGGGKAMGKSPKASGTAGKSGGGSKSSKKKFDPKDKEKADTKKYTERYETITNALEEFNDCLEHTSKAMQDAWGPARLNQMAKYQSQLKTIAKTQQSMIKEVQGYHDIDKAALMATPLGAMAKFAGGQYSDLTNPEELRNYVQSIYEAAVAAKNEVYEAYNQAGLGGLLENEDIAAEWEEKLKAADDKFSDAEDQCDEWIEALNQFLETHDKLREEIEKQIQNFRDYIAAKVDEIDYKLELKLKIPTSEIRLLERFIDKLGDTGILNGDSLKAIGEIWSRINSQVGSTVDSGYELVDMIKNLNPSNTSQLEAMFGPEAVKEYLADTSGVPAVVMEKFEEYIDNLEGYVDELYNQAQAAFDGLMKQVNAFFDKFTDIFNTLDRRLSRLDLLEKILDVSNIAYTQQGRDARRQIADARADTAKTRMYGSQAEFELSKTEYANAEAEVKRLQAMYDAATDEDKTVRGFALDNAIKRRQEAYDRMNDLEVQHNEDIGAWIDQMKENFDQEMELLTQEFESGLNGMFSTLQDAIDMFSQYAKLKDWYLDPVETKYEFDSLLAKVDKAMEDTTDMETLKRLQEYRDRIVAKQAEGKKITQEEMNIENKRLELLQAEAALEEQMNNAANEKNTMRLHRDASGNYAYVYSSDGVENKVDEAEQRIRDLKNDIYELEKAAMRAADEKYYQTYKEYSELIRLYETEYYQHDQQWRDMIKQKLAWYEQELENIVFDSETFGQMMVEDFSEVELGYNSSITAMIGGFEDLRSMHEVYLEKAKEYDMALEVATQEMQSEIEYELEQMGINYEDFAATVKEETDQVIRDNEATRQEIKYLKDSGKQYLSELGNAFQTWANQTISQIDAVIAKIRELQAAMNAAQQANTSAASSGGSKKTLDVQYLEALEAGDIELANKIYAQRGKDIDANYSSILGKDIQGDKVTSQATLDKLGKAISDAVAEGNYDLVRAIKEDYINNNDDYRQGKGKYASATGNLFTKPAITSVAENGPEIVLNAQDTANILAAVQAMRETVNSQMYSKLTGLRTATQNQQEMAHLDNLKKEVATGDFEQNVYINASFPGVSVESEIKAAFNDLVVQAAQYRGRRQ